MHAANSAFAASALRAALGSPNQCLLFHCLAPDAPLSLPLSFSSDARVPLASTYSLTLQQLRLPSLYCQLVSR
jgi:hypothetical protein